MEKKWWILIVVIVLGVIGYWWYFVYDGGINLSPPFYPEPPPGEFRSGRYGNCRTAIVEHNEPTNPPTPADVVCMCDCIESGVMVPQACERVIMGWISGIPRGAVVGPPNPNPDLCAAHNGQPCTCTGEGFV